LSAGTTYQEARYNELRHEREQNPSRNRLNPDSIYPGPSPPRTVVHPHYAVIMSNDSDLQPGQSLAHLLPPSWTQDIPKWFQEDTPSFDWAGFVVGEEEQEAWLLGKSGVS